MVMPITLALFHIKLLNVNITRPAGCCIKLGPSAASPEVCTSITSLTASSTACASVFPFAFAKLYVAIAVVALLYFSAPENGILSKFINRALLELKSAVDCLEPSNISRASVCSS